MLVNWARIYYGTFTLESESAHGL